MEFKSECKYVINQLKENLGHIDGFKEYTTLNDESRILSMSSLKVTLELFQHYTITDIINDIENFSICKRMLEFGSTLEEQILHKE